MNKPAYLGISILEISKIVIHEFWYEYIPKYREKAKLCSMDTDFCFIVYIKTKNFDVDILKDVKTRFDTSNFQLQRLLLRGKCKKGIRGMKN